MGVAFSVKMHFGLDPPRPCQYKLVCGSEHYSVERVVKGLRNEAGMGLTIKSCGTRKALSPTRYG